MAGDAVWLDVLPSMAAFGSKLLDGAQKEGQKAGVAAGAAFGKALGASDGGSAELVAKLKKNAAAAEKVVASETQGIAKARAAQREATAKVIEAEDKLERARQSGDQAKTAAAEERLAAARDRQEAAAAGVVSAEKRLASAGEIRRDAVADLIKAEGKLAEETKDSANAAEKSATGMGRFKEQVAGASDSAKKGVDGVGKLAVGLGGLLAAAEVFKEGWASALDLTAGTAKMKTSLGLTAEQSAEAGKAAGALYAAGWGESLSDMTSSVSAVLSSMPDLQFEGADKIAEVTRQAQGLADAFDIDVSEAARNASVWIANGLVTDATEGFDLMVYSLQRVPEALRGEVMDASHEYAGVFSQIGMDGARMMETLVGASSMGQYAIDKVGDSVKEFSIRATDGSKRSADAFKVLGLNSQEMARDVATGGEVGAAAFQKTVDALLGIEDPAKQAQTAIALFGTPMEDLGTDKIPYFLESLAGGQDAFEGWQGSATEAADALAASVDPLESFQRSMMGVVTEGLMPFVGPAKEMADWAKENPAVVQGVIVVLGLLATALTVAAVAQWAMNAALLANPMTWVIVGIGLLIAAIVLLWQNWDTVTQWLGATFGPIMEAAGDWFTNLGARAAQAWVDTVGAFQGAADWIGGTFLSLWESSIGWISDQFDGAVGAVSQGWEATKAAFQGAADWVSGTWSMSWSEVGKFMSDPVGYGASEVDRLFGTDLRGSLDGAHAWVRDTWATGWAAVRGFIADPVGSAKVGIDEYVRGVRDIFTGVDMWMSKAFGPAWTRVKDMLAAPIDGAKNAIDWTLGAVKTAFENTVRNVTNIWAGIQDAVKSPVKFVIDVVLNNGLIGAFNTIAGFVGARKIDPIKIPGFDTGGYTGAGGRYEPRGVVHAGEVVWSQDDVAAWGGPQRVDAMRRQRDGYAGGGIVANARQGFNNYNPTFLNAIRSWAAETGRMFYMTGNGGARSRADQERAYALHLSGRGPLAARPGTSAHEGGRAMDVNPWPNAREVALLSQFGLGLTVRGEPWHIGWRGGALPGGSTGGGGGFGLDIGGMFKGLVDKIPKVGGDTILSQLLNAVPGKLVEGVTTFITDKIAAVGNFFTGGGGGTAAGAPGVKDLARQLAAGRGWTGPQWSALDWLVNKESSWNPSAKNPTSTAYGLFQFLDSTWGTVGARKTSDPRGQIEAGLQYIAQRYGSPTGAQAFWQRNRWYDEGGILEPGTTVALNGTGQREHVLTNRQADTVDRMITDVQQRHAGSADVTPEQIREAFEGMRMRVDIDNGEVWFEKHANRRDRTKARQERARTGVS